MKELVLKDWIFQKIAREHNAPRIWSAHVDAIFAETEKAYKVMLGSVNYTVYVWVPKSQCEWQEAESETMETKIFKTYEEAAEYRSWLRSCYC